ncbi:MAG: protein kinase [Kofleriaceae bacterium]
MTGPAQPSDLGVRPGQVLLGKYRVDAILGHGGMGVVVAATHLGLDERVAIKLLRTDVAHDDETRQRFLREAQATAKLKSEHVARVSDVGVFPGGSPYMVMEFLEGADLGAVLERRGRLPAHEAAELVLQACVALAEAHAIGIVHRDIKPANLFLTRRGDDTPLVKLFDFGISKSAQLTDLKLTQTQSVLGTPAYMSPEQMRSAKNVDHRTDIWSIGSVLYEAVAGRRPFEAESFSEMVVMVVSDPPSPLPADVPAPLAAIITRCLAKQPAARFANVAELGRALAPMVRDADGARVLVDRMQRLASRRGHTPLPDGPIARAAKPLPLAATERSQPYPVVSGTAATPATVPDEPGLGPEPGDDEPTAARAPLSQRRPSRPAMIDAATEITVGPPAAMPAHVRATVDAEAPPALPPTPTPAPVRAPRRGGRRLVVAIVATAASAGIAFGVVLSQRDGAGPAAPAPVPLAAPPARDAGTLDAARLDAAPAIDAAPRCRAPDGAVAPVDARPAPRPRPRRARPRRRRPGAVPTTCSTAAIRPRRGSGRARAPATRYARPRWLVPWHRWSRGCWSSSPATPPPIPRRAPRPIGCSPRAAACSPAATSAPPAIASRRRRASTT